MLTSLQLGQGLVETVSLCSTVSLHISWEGLKVSIWLYLAGRDRAVWGWDLKSSENPLTHKHIALLCRKNLQSWGLGCLGCSGMTVSLGDVLSPQDASNRALGKLDFLYVSSGLPRYLWRETEGDRERGATLYGLALEVMQPHIRNILFIAASHKGLRNFSERGFRLTL